MSKPTLLSEDALDQRFAHRALLESGGDYGCGCVLFEGDLEDGDGETLFGDAWFYALNEEHPNDLGTVLVTGSVRSKQELSISDRLMCLVILGSVEAPALSVFDTEMYVGGALTVGTLTDEDDRVTVAGERILG